MEHIEAHTMRLLGTVPAATMKSSAVHFQPDDVLYGRLRPYLNKVYRPDFEGLCSAEFIVFPKTQGINSRFLQYFLNSSAFVSFASHLNTGDRPRVDFEQLASYPFPIASSKEQEQVVAEIEKHFSRLDEAVASLKRTKANLKRYKSAVLKAAVEGKLTEEWRKKHLDIEPASKLLERILIERRTNWNGKGKYQEATRLDMNDLTDLPVGWEWCLSDLLFSFVTSGSRGWARYYSEEGPLFLRVGNLDHDSIRLDFKDIQRVSPPIGAEGTRTKVQSGDILVSITADVGMIAVVPQGFEEAYINQHIALARPVPEICREYLAWYLAAPDGGQKQFRRLQRGATKAGLGLDDIRAVQVPIPPLAEQQQIVAEVDRRISVINELQTIVGANLTRADRLRQAILNQMFGLSENPLPYLSEGEGSMKTKPIPVLPAPRKTNAEDGRVDLVEVLSRHPNGVAVEDLFVEACYRGDQIDQFFRDLSLIASRVEQELPPTHDGVWPYAGPAIVRLRSKK